MMDPKEARVVNGFAEAFARRLREHAAAITRKNGPTSLGASNVLLGLAGALDAGREALVDTGLLILVDEIREEHGRG